MKYEKFIKEVGIRFQILMTLNSNTPSNTDEASTNVMKCGDAISTGQTTLCYSYVRIH